MISAQRDVRPSLRIVPAPRFLRVTAGVGAGLAALWDAYTLAYFWLQPHHLTGALDVFLLFGIPGPTTGVTRTFAWMWRGELGRAAEVYPLGPLVFVISLLLTVYVVWIAASGRALSLTLPRRGMLAAGIVLAGLLAINWALKIFWLGIGPAV
ncbi:MAG: DUF2752 domain-containing protein [Candidatus Dormibacteraceae bacterium]